MVQFDLFVVCFTLPCSYSRTGLIIRDKYRLFIVIDIDEVDRASDQRLADEDRLGAKITFDELMRREAVISLSKKCRQDLRANLS